MKFLLASICFLFILGCGDKPVADGPTSASMNGTQNKAATTTGAATSGTPSDATTGTDTPMTSASTTGSGSTTAEGNPNRVFQLKDLTTALLKVNGHELKVWLMDTPGKREEGMMWLHDNEVKEDEGMLFVFTGEQDTSNGFWMQNTVLPLDIIYADKTRKVLNIAEGQPFDTTNLKASAPYMYVLELKMGTAKNLGIKSGNMLEFASSIKAER